MNEERLSQLKRDVAHYYQQKYGKVSVTFEEFSPVGENAADLAATISDQAGFITRYYGRVAYEEGRLHLRAMSI